MAERLKSFLRGTAPSSSSLSPNEDPDFADFAGAPEPSPASLPVTPSFSNVAGDAPGRTDTLLAQRPYTKWYRVWERTTVADFYQEMFILPVLLLLLVIHYRGKRANRQKAKAWTATFTQPLQQEFASVGFGGRKAPTLDEVQSTGLVKATLSDELNTADQLLQERSANEYTTYATGRQNVAFADIKLVFSKRYNPFLVVGEMILGVFFESMPATSEKVEATAYCFDGKEADVVPPAVSQEGQDVAETRKPVQNSTFDGFVWGIVHKDALKRLRDSRYDLSLTSTKDHPRLPPFVTVMSESAEVTETLLTPELAKAVEEAGDALEALIVTDQPVDQPKRLAELASKKRASVALKLPADQSDYARSLPLFRYFLRLPDHLVESAHFRPEALRRVKQTREDEERKIRRLDEQGQAEERKLQGDKEKRKERDARLSSMSAEDQRKFLEKEREKDLRKTQKKRTVKG